MNRPTAVSVISWILIVVSVLNLLTTTVSANHPLVLELMKKNPLPIPAQFAMIYIGLTVSLVSGIAMLGGHNWGRWLYAIWGSLGMIFGVATSPIKTMMIPGIILFVVMVCFLFQPATSRFFVQPDASND